MNIHPLFKVVGDGVLLISDHSTCESLVGSSVMEVVSHGKVDVGIPFNDGRAKVLVTRNNEKLALLLKVIESLVLVREQVGSAKARPK